MHESNVLTAWALAAHDALAAAARAGELDQRSLAALTLVDEHDGRSLEWLRERIGLTQSGTVRLVDRLAGAGLVRRSPRDGRTVALSITAEGAAALGRWRAARDAAVADLLDGLGPRDRAALVALLGRSLERRPRRRREADATCRGCDWDACGDACPVAHSVVAET